ncbi:MAG: outer membrane beta-barrel protein [Microvirga sp.]|nr:outer membrane beta-barrel protein [Microvirga sp.]
MRASIFAGMAIAAVIVAAPAQSADLFGSLRGTQNVHPGQTVHNGMTPVTTWQGAYFGGFAGIASGQANPGRSLQSFLGRELRLNTFENRNGLSNWISLPAGKEKGKNFGVFAGYNFQFDEAVLGFEADYTRLNLRLTSTDSLTRVIGDLTGLFGLEGQPGNVTMTGRSNLHLKDLMTLRARAGYTAGSFMPFVTAGVALANYELSQSAERRVVVLGTGQTATAAYGPQNKSGFAFGFAGGAGVDVALGQNGFMRGEWQYAHFRDIQGVKATLHNIRAATGVRF